jgi:DNA-binding CsgD family transcriptional regulator
MSTESSNSANYLSAVSEFITFLSRNNLNFDEILRHMVLVVFSPINVEAITYRILDHGDRAVRVATWGMPAEMVQKRGDVYDFNDRYPSNDTLRYRRITWINALPDWGDDYPLLKPYPYTTGAKSFICFPINRSGTPVAALGIFSKDVITPNSEIASFLEAVGSVLSMHMSLQSSMEQNSLEIKEVHSQSSTEIATTDLTERQLVILRLMGEDRTNHVISELLGYSESTIRQETMKIFTLLHCDGRQEAKQIYKDQFMNSAKE